MSELQNNISIEEQDHRISICIMCEGNVLETYPKCNACNLPISQLTSDREEVCPLNKWN